MRLSLILVNKIDWVLCGNKSITIDKKNTIKLPTMPQISIWINPPFHHYGTLERCLKFIWKKTQCCFTVVSQVVHFWFHYDFSNVSLVFLCHCCFIDILLFQLFHWCNVMLFHWCTVMLFYWCTVMLFHTSLLFYWCNMLLFHTSLCFTDVMCCCCFTDVALVSLGSWFYWWNVLLFNFTLVSLM